jgi:RHS repeat-associated protein
VFKSGSSSNYASLYYYSTNQVKSITYGNSLYVNYTYDSLSRPLKITLTKPGSHGTTTTLLSLTYAYNKTGTVTSVNGQVNSVTVSEQYMYDNIQRLTNATLTNGNARTTLSYSYDSLGNRLWQKQNGTVTNYSYNQDNNELKSSSSTSTSSVYSYDPNGNLLTKNVTNSGTVHWTYTWDPAGHLVRTSNDNGVQGAYSYDADGRLVGSKEGTTTSFYAYLGTETLYQSIIGSSSTDYIFAGGTRIGKVTGTTVSYYHADAEGNTRLVTSSIGSILFADNYLPFGQDNGMPTGSEVYKFIGKPWSSTIGLYYDYQRWYDPSTGRFISQDSGKGDLSRPQSLNGFAYALNNPLSFADINGAGPVNITWLKIFAGVYGAITRSHIVTSILSIPIPPKRWGNWFVGKASDHTVWSAGRPDFPGIRSDFELIAKLDKPDMTSPKPMQWFYHRVAGADENHFRVSDPIGEVSDAFFKFGPDISKGMLVAGLIISTVDVVSAYQQGMRQGDLVLTQEVFSWAGALGGAELGAAIGTALFPGVGTVIGGIIGGVAGGVGGGAFGDWVGNQLVNISLPGFIIYGTPAYGEGRANPT